MVEPLSTLILRGCEDTFPAIHTLETGAGVTTCCALGAAFHAKYPEVKDADLGDVLNSLYAAGYASVLHTELEHPVRFGQRDMVEDLIVSLNDNIGWSREQIAEWLRSYGL